MSKRNSDSKKNEANLPNFVFDLNKSSSGFSSSNPTGSVPANSSTGFTFNNPTTTQFSFGMNAETKSLNTGSLKRQQEDLGSAPNKKGPSGFRTNNPESNTPVSTFQFGNTTSSFNLSKTAASSSAESSTAFNFTPTASIGFSFPSSTTNVSTTPAKNNESPFTFSFPTPSTSTASSTPPATSKDTTSFSFITPTTSTETTKTTSSFGSTAPTTSTDTTKTNAFSFTTPKVSTDTTKTTSFSFTAPTTSTDPTKTSTFSFTKPVTSIDTTKTSTSGFTAPSVEKQFCSNLTATSTPSAATTPTLVSSASPATSLAFGSKPAEASSNPTFTFGTSAETSKSTTASTISFGSKTTDDNKSTSGFTFGATSATSTPASTFTFGDKKDEKSSTTNAPSKPNVFSFVKLLEDLEKAAVQSSGQIYATLISSQPSVFQSETVHHTSFRIDHILPSTRFTELPELAQHELDEVEKYMRLESQRCDYIKSHKVRHYRDAANQATHQIESLTQQLDVVSSMLRGQKESTESTYDTVKEQLRFAKDGSCVLEACKHPENNARWLFGYTEDDDYFLQLSKQLSKRIEEYKKCIWEIERTTESWTQNKVRSPQDIASVMRAQNEAFLSLSNKVAILHEKVTAEKNNYSQYLKMYD